MGIRFRCPFCDQRLNIKNQQAGKKGVCPNCRRKIQVPVESELEKSGRPIPPSSAKRSESTESASHSSSHELPNPLGEADSADTLDLEIQDSSSATSRPSLTDSTKASLGVNRDKPIDVLNADSSDSVSADMSEIDPVDFPESSRPLDDKFRLGAPGTEVRPDYVDPILEAPHRVWHIRDTADRQSGPFSGKQLRRKIDSGRVKPEHSVCREDWEDWMSASEVFPEIGMAMSAIPLASDRVFTDSNYQISSDLNPKARKAKQKRRKHAISIGLIVFGLLITIGLCYLLLTLI